MTDLNNKSADNISTFLLYFRADQCFSADPPPTTVSRYLWQSGRAQSAIAILWLERKRTQPNLLFWAKPLLYFGYQCSSLRHKGDCCGSPFRLACNIGIYVQLWVKNKIPIMDGQVINIDEDILGGTPVFYGTRVPIKNLFDYLETGETIEIFLDDFEGVSKSQVIRLLEML